MQSAGSCELNPLSRSPLASVDAVSSIKILLLKLVYVLVSTALDRVGSAQVVLMLIAMTGVVFYTLEAVRRSVGAGGGQGLRTGALSGHAKRGAVAPMCVHHPAYACWPTTLAWQQDPSCSRL